MPPKHVVSRLKDRDWDWEKVGRALIEYGGVPLAFFMTAGIVVTFLQGYGRYHSFFDPLNNFHLYYVLNAWMVALVYVYRQKYQPSLLFETRTEIGIAAIAGLAWLLIQPVLLIVGYTAYLVAVLRHESLHGSFLPDIENHNSEDGEPEKSRAWGHIEEIRSHMR